MNRAELLGRAPYACVDRAKSAFWEGRSVNLGGDVNRAELLRASTTDVVPRRLPFAKLLASRRSALID